MSLVFPFSNFGFYPLISHSSRNIVQTSGLWSRTKIVNAFSPPAGQGEYVYIQYTYIDMLLIVISDVFIDSDNTTG